MPDNVYISLMIIHVHVLYKDFDHSLKWKLCMVHHTLWDLPFILILASGPDRLRKVPPGTWFILTFNLKLRFIKYCPFALPPPPTPTPTSHCHHTFTQEHYKPCYCTIYLNTPWYSVPLSMRNMAPISCVYIYMYLYKKEILKLHFLLYMKEESFHFFQNLSLFL